MTSPPYTPGWGQSAYPTPSSSTSILRQSTKSTSKSTSISENVQVLVRCRPAKSEKELREEPCWDINSERGSIGLARPSNITAFNYDSVFKGVSNEQVYNSGIYNLVRSSMIGYNGTVFAYGQTASGKTYTMMGTETEPGVIPRAIKQVFSHIEEDTAGREYLLRVSYMEIYNEKIKDLLNSENIPEIVEDKKRGTHVRNLKESIVKTVKEVMTCIKDGESNRHISATDYNEHSSRSHTIFQLVIESCSKGLPDRGVRVSQLNLIDLAGSEKVATDIERRKEGSYINKSLLTLGNVISKLTSEEPSAHIPFRDSKLTRILQGALSGNARVAVICTINPTLSSKDESLNTLRFAQRAKLIKTAAKMMRVDKDSELENCLLKIAELQLKMQEKNNLEAETRQRLKSLLGHILTSSKIDQQQIINQSETLSQFSNLTADDLSKDTTMRDVVALCEEEFAAKILAHEKQMDTMALHVKSMQDDMKIMTESLYERDAELLKLKNENDSLKQMLKKPESLEASTQSTPAFTLSASTQTHPISDLTPAFTSSASTQTHPISDLTPAIHQAVQHVSEAISTGIISEENCLEQIDLSHAVSSVFQNVVASTMLNKPRDVNLPKYTITQTLQNAIQSSIADAPVFISIDEAVSYIPTFVHNYPTALPIHIIEDQEVPELISVSPIFTSIHKAVLILQVAHSYLKTQTVDIIEEAVPELSVVPYLIPIHKAVAALQITHGYLVTPTITMFEEHIPELLVTPNFTSIHKAVTMVRVKHNCSIIPTMIEDLVPELIVVSPDFTPIYKAVSMLQFVHRYTMAQTMITIEESIPDLLDAVPTFTPIHEAVLHFTPSYLMSATVSVLETEDPVPELIGQEIVTTEDEDEEDDSDDFASFWENKNLVCNSSDDSDIESGDMETCDMETDVMKLGILKTVVVKSRGMRTVAIETNEILMTTEDSYIAYSKSINQILPFSILFNRWIILCISLYVIFKQTI